MPRNNNNENNNEYNEEEIERLRIKRAITGSIAKMHPNVYREIKREAEELGLDPSELIFEMFEIWRMGRTIEEVEPRSFLAGYMFGMFELRRAISYLNALGKLWVSEYMTAQASLLEQLNKQREIIHKQIREEVEAEIKAREQTSKTTDIKETILKFIFELIKSKLGMKQSVEKPNIQVEVT